MLNVGGQFQHSTFNILHFCIPVTLSALASHICMRQLSAILMIAAAPLFAQPAPTSSRPNELMMIERYESRLQRLAVEVKRDSFIVAQVVQGSGELSDFQKYNAIQKALDRVEAAIRRANDDPKASPFTMTALSQTKDALLHGRDQGSTADLPALQKLMIEKTRVPYKELFRELDIARRERQALSDVQAKLAQINQDLDGAMVEALGSTFDFIRAGGK